MAETTAILQAELESAGRTQAIHGRRQHGKRHRILDLAEGDVGPVGNRSRRIVAAALGPVFEGAERQRRILPATGEAEPENHHAVANARLTGVVRFNLLGHLHRAILARTRRQLDVGDGVTLVFHRQERGGQATEGQAQTDQQHAVDQQVAPGTFQRIGNPALITLGQLLEATVEPAEEPGLFVVLAFGNRLEQRRAQGRGQGQGEEGREQDRGGHRQRELLVDHPDRALHERHRNEHRDQHQGDADDGPGDLLHGLARGFLGRQAFGGHDPLDVLHHHNRVVHQNADGQHHAEHGQHVDRKPQRQHRRKSAHQCHRHHQGRNQRVADVLQEQEHHREHQQHRLKEGVDHLGDRNLDERRGVVRDRVLDVRREIALEFVHLRPHQGRGVQRVGTGRELHGDGGGRFAVQACGKLVFLATDLDPRHIADAHGRAVRIGLEDDVGKLFGGRQLTLDQNGRGDFLGGAGRQIADAARRHLGVLRNDGGVDVRRRQVEGEQFLRVDPDPHRPFGAVQLRLADAVQTLDLVHHVARQVIAERHVVEFAVAGGQGDQQQEAGGDFLHLQTLLDHRLRQP
ncbi:hypothetical protein D3C87_1133430 [compost metagenome]